MADVRSCPYRALVPLDNPLVLVVIFLASATVVVVAGTRLARHGAVIAARTQLGGLWVGSLSPTPA